MSIGKTPAPLAALRGLLFLNLVGLIAAAADLLVNRPYYEAPLLASAKPILSLRLAVLAFGFAVAALGATLLFLRRAPGLRTPALPETNPWRPVRFYLYAAFATLIANSAAHRFDYFTGEGFFLSSFSVSVLLLTTSLVSLAALLLPRPQVCGRRGPAAWLDLLLLNGAAFLCLAEVFLTAYARLSSSEFFWNQSSVLSTIRTHRGLPGRKYFGFPMNSRGFYDEEFFAAGPRDFVAALVADSFGVGIVPHDYNVSVVARRALREKLGNRFERVAVPNFGIRATGMPEYAWIIENEVPSVNPSAILLCVFVGNDFEKPDPRLQQRNVLQNWWIYRLPQRLLAARAAHNGGNGQAAPVPEDDSPGEQPDSLPAYVLDPSKEPEHFPEHLFLGVENARLELLNPTRPRTEELYAHFFEQLKAVRAMAGGKLMVVLEPDELQVNDALYARLLAAKKDPSPYRREYPQEKVAASCRALGIPLLDLLPDLRAAEANGHTYHLYDTHWNARGNAVAGKAIARGVLKEFLGVTE